jgi:hypothetical protein
VPPALSAKDLSGGQMHILTVRQIWRINRHPIESDDDSAPESISDTEGWRIRNGDLDYPNHSEDNCTVHVESDVE